MSDPLVDVELILADSQHIGFLGRRPLPQVIDQARLVTDALATTTGEICDLGAGGGVPGLVIAALRPDLRLVLIDRRQKRTDFLRRAVSRLGWTDRVEVVTDDVEHLIADPAWQERFAASVSRGFGPPVWAVTMASRLVRPSGLVVLTEPPAGHPDRWDPAVLAEADLERLSPVGAAVAVFRRR